MIKITKEAVRKLNIMLSALDIEDDEVLEVSQRSVGYLRLVVPNSRVSLVWNPSKEVWDYKVV